MMRPVAANDFAAIRARIDELRRERVLIARNRAVETTVEPHRQPTSRGPAPIDEGDLPSGEPHRR
jgi:hypothetical protein